MRISDWSSDVCSSDLAAGQPDAALDVLVAFAAKDADFNSAESRSLVGSYAKAREPVETKKAHGHEVLLTYLRSNVEQIGSRPDGRKPGFIKIGRPRANSTEKRSVGQECVVRRRYRGYR